MPSDILKLSAEDFQFNLLTIEIGMKSEAEQMRKAHSNGRRKNGK